MGTYTSYTSRYIIFFQIQFWKKKSGEMMREVDYIVNQPKQYPRPRTKRDAGELLEYRITNLPPYADILLQVRVLNKYYVGPPSAVINFKTQEGREYQFVVCSSVSHLFHHFS